MLTLSFVNRSNMHHTKMHDVRHLPHTSLNIYQMHWLVDVRNMNNVHNLKHIIGTFDIIIFSENQQFHNSSCEQIEHQWLRKKIEHACSEL